MRYQTNPEGMTFEEWICAAGVARFAFEMVTPYTCGGRPEYPRALRAAWRAGVDPTEYRQTR